MATEIELLGLWLNIKRDDKGAKFPVMSASIQYRVGQLPAVQITVSSAALFNKSTDSANGFSSTIDDDDIRDLLVDSPDGTWAELQLDLSINGSSSVTSLILAAGYISGVGSNLATSIYTVQSNISFRLVSRLGAINANPGGVFTTFSVIGKSGNTSPLPYQYWIKTRTTAFKPGSTGKTEYGASLQDLFKTNPAQCILGILDHLRNTNAKVSKVKISTCFDASNIAFAVEPKTENTDNIINKFNEKLGNALVGSPSAGVAIAALRELLLTVVPQTLAKKDAKEEDLGLMVVRPSATGWCPDPKVELDAGDILGIGDTTAYRLDNRVDFWYVVETTDPKLAGLPSPAVYAPQYGENGEAKFLDEKELQRAVDSTAKSQEAFIGRMTVLPWWLVLAMKRETTGSSSKNSQGNKGGSTTRTQESSSSSAAKLPGTLTNSMADPSILVKNQGTTIPAVQNLEETKKAWKDMCKRIAVLGFLENGCAVNNVSLRLPFATLLKLLPWLGDTISFKTPSPAQTSKNKELYDITGTTRYGLLDGLSMTFEMNYKEIHVACGATLSQVHDEKLHEQMAAANPLYKEASDICYNKQALKIVEVLF